MVRQNITTLTKGRVRIDLEHIGEGWNGDYQPDNANDAPLLRFYVYLDDEAIEDASYCTQLPDTLPPETKAAAIVYLMEEIYNPASEGHSIKKLCERLSWIHPSWLTPQARNDD